MRARTLESDADGNIRRRAQPTTPWVLAYPGTRFSSPHHFTVDGDMPITSKLLKPILRRRNSADDCRS